MTKKMSKNVRKSMKNGFCAGVCGLLLTSLVGCSVQGQMSSVDLMKENAGGENVVTGAGEGALTGGDTQGNLGEGWNFGDGGEITVLTGMEYRFEDNGALALTDFGVELLKNCYEQDANTLISPLSVMSALGMTGNGAKGETLKQMLEVFGIPMEKLNAYLQEYRTNLPNGEKYKLNLANAIWFKDAGDFTAEQDFLDINRKYYDAGVYGAPFDESTINDINHWVEEKTDGMIEKVLDEISEDAVMYLLNALAFEAEWQEIYYENQIQEGEFTTESGEVRNVELMYSEETCYLQDENAEGFLKYYKDKSYAFAALLPDEGVTVAEYLEGLTGEKLNGILTNAETQSVNAAIPKFKVEYDVEMSKVLMAMGMTDAFESSKADLSGLGHSVVGNLYIEQVIHKTFMEVDAQGTKAAAATMVQVNCERAMEKEPVEVILDRPFVYMIIDCEENVPVFIGTMMDMAQ